MKVFQELKAGIKEWEDSRSLIISICRELNCSESEIIGKIEQLKTARPANDLNNINEKLEELMEGLDYAKGRAEDVEDKVDSAFSELEYVDASDARAGIDDVHYDFDEFRKEIKKQLDGSKG